jgi:hypothetical protein
VYTRCTGCHTAHPVNASLLAQGKGRFRCGKCQKMCNALDALFDERPGAGDQPPTAGDLPVLGLSIDLERARKSRLEPDTAALTGELDAAAAEPAKTGSLLARLSWIVIAIVITFFIVAEYTKFQEKSLVDLPMVKSVMTRLGFLDPPAAPVFRDLDLIHLASRELRSHPFKSGTLQLTATVVNQAPQSQPFPGLEVILLDSAGEAVSRARFTPSDYLADGAPVDSLMTPQAFLPLTLDLPDPGRKAVGFELNFE